MKRHFYFCQQIGHSGLDGDRLRSYDRNIIGKGSYQSPHNLDEQKVSLSTKKHHIKLENLEILVPRPTTCEKVTSVSHKETANYFESLEKETNPFPGRGRDLWSFPSYGYYGPAQAQTSTRLIGPSWVNINTKLVSNLEQTVDNGHHSSLMTGRLVRGQHKRKVGGCL